MHSIEPTISLASSGESGGGERRLLLKMLASPLLRRGELRPPPAPAIAAQLQLATVATAWRCCQPQALLRCCCMVVQPAVPSLKAAPAS